MSNSKNQAYYDRNQAVMVMAKLAMLQGHTVGVSINPNEPDWPVLMIEFPTGQVGWHIPKAELTGDWPKYSKPWDGHSLQDKRERLQQYLLLRDE